MRTERLELSREYPLEPKSSASTNFATSAIYCKDIITDRFLHCKQLTPVNLIIIRYKTG